MYDVQLLEHHRVASDIEVSIEGDVFEPLLDWRISKELTQYGG